MNNYPLSRKADLVVQEMDGEVLIYDLEKNRAFCLNETSAAVWRLCDGNRSILELAGELGRLNKSEASEDLIWLALDQLKKESLIQSELEPVFAGLSRREVIKKVGLGTMIALPIVASLVAPTAIFAQSGCIPAAMNPPGCPCSSPSNCAPGNCSNVCTGPTGMCCG